MDDLQTLLTRIRESLTTRLIGRAEDVVEGRNRRVFLMRGYVIKVPLNYEGIDDNLHEGKQRRPAGPLGEYETIYARTRLVHHHDIPVLLMERVTHATSAALDAYFGKIPSWVYGIDCCQVGFTKDGRLVAYDYGRH